MKTECIVMVPCKVEFSILSVEEIPSVCSASIPNFNVIKDCVVIVKHEESINFPYYNLIGTIGEFTILQKRQ